MRGLEDQLLGETVKKKIKTRYDKYELLLVFSFLRVNLFMYSGRVILMEKADLEAERVALFESVIQNQRSMKEFESNLLHKLSSIQVTGFKLIFCSFLSMRKHTFFDRIKNILKMTRNTVVMF